MQEEPRVVTRRVRKRIDRPGLRADVAADLNLVVSGGSAAGRQRVSVRQGRAARQGTSQDKEQT